MTNPEFDNDEITIDLTELFMINGICRDEALYYAALYIDNADVCIDEAR